LAHVYFNKFPITCTLHILYKSKAVNQIVLTVEHASPPFLHKDWAVSLQNIGLYHSTQAVAS